MSDDLKHGGARRADEASARKPYRRPTVVRYGDVTSLTRGGSVGAKNDKGSGSKTRTF